MEVEVLEYLLIDPAQQMVFIDATYALVGAVHAGIRQDGREILNGTGEDGGG